MSEYYYYVVGEVEFHEYQYGSLYAAAIGAEVYAFVTGGKSEIVFCDEVSNGS